MSDFDPSTTAAPKNARHMGIRWKLVLPFVLVSLLLASILLPLTRQLVASSVETEADRQLAEVSGSVAALMEDSQRRAQISAEFIANLPEVYNVLGASDQLSSALMARKEELGLQELSLYASDYKPGDAPLYYGGPTVTRRFQSSAEVLAIRNELLAEVIATGKPASRISITPQSSQILGAAPVRLAGQWEKFQGIIIAAYFVDEAYVQQIGNTLAVELGILKDNAIIASTIQRSSGYETLLQQDDPGQPTSARTIVYEDGAQYRLYKTPLILSGKEHGYVLVARPIAAFFQLKNSIQAIFLLFILLVVITSLVIGLAASASFSGPLTRLANATKDMRQGLLNQRVPVSYFMLRDEVTDLTEDFNEMAARLKELYEGLEEKVAERTQQLIEEQKKLEVANFNLAEARDQAVAANQAKSEFVSVVSHELKVPMTSIKGYTDLLLGGMAGELNQSQKDFLQTVRTNVQRMATLVSDLTDISRLETGHLRIEPGVVHLQEVIEEVANALKSQFMTKKQALEIDIASDLPDLWCDRNRLAQILANLISNANKYTPEGGKVSIKAEDCVSSDRGIVVEVLQITIQDTGYGISKEEQIKLFQKFFRSEDSRHRQAPGTGLGLVITKNLIELQGGKIWFKSELNQGTTFSFMLPTAHQPNV